MNKMDDTQRIVKCGNLSLHTPGGFFKKRWHNKYLVLYDGSKSGIKRLELFESEIKFKKQNPEKIIPLVDCVRVVTCQRQRSSYTFEVRTSDQFYLLAAQSFQAMNDWVNCLRLVAFGQQLAATTVASLDNQPRLTPPANGSRRPNGPTEAGLVAGNKQGANSNPPNKQTIDLLLERRPLTEAAHQVSGASSGPSAAGPLVTASQAAAAAANALAKTRQRQPSLLGSCKPQPPGDSPFISGQVANDAKPDPELASTRAGSLGALLLDSMGQLDTMTPTVRGQLISTKNGLATACSRRQTAGQQPQPLASSRANITTASNDIGGPLASSGAQILNKVDEEEENMLYCSIEDNPSEHNYRVKVIETELALRCQLKCYQLTAPTLISEQYEELAQFRHQFSANGRDRKPSLPHIVTFYQLIVGPQELTLLNDYATSATNAANKQQGLWSWPYQCIRRYGFDKDNCFLFEAGRKCTSGPGQFIVQTPKAYNIYQDVVKFVNELRTINGTATTAAAAAAAAATTTTTTAMAPNGGAWIGHQTMVSASNGSSQKPDNEMEKTPKPSKLNLKETDLNQQQLVARQLVVTQIPVVWAPNEQSAGAGTESAPDEQPSDDKKRHFFDALRQSTGTGNQSSCQPPASNGTSIDQNHHSTSRQQLSGNCITKWQEATTNGDVGGPSSSNGHELRPRVAGSSAADNRPRVLDQQVVAASTICGAAKTDVTNGCGVGDGNDCGKKLNYAPAGQLNQTIRDNYNNEASTIRKPPVCEPTEGSMSLVKASVATTRHSQSDHDTDESGYEHGDESVDSCSASSGARSLRKTTTINGHSNNNSSIVAGRKRQLAKDSMSSASSTSSEAMTTSPSQSVSRGSMGRLGSRFSNSLTGLPSRSPSVSAKTDNQALAKRSPNIHSLRQDNIIQNIPQEEAAGDHLIGRPSGFLAGTRQPSLDFEANLIRDVYCEISKLHAKFAVTTSGSAEDSMSSGSGSSRDSASSDQLEKDSEDLDEVVANIDRRLGGRADHDEPMYSNIETKPTNNGAIFSEDRKNLYSLSGDQMTDNSSRVNGPPLSASSRLNVNNNLNLQHAPKPQQLTTTKGIAKQRLLEPIQAHINSNTSANCRSNCLEMNYLSTSSNLSTSSSRQMYPTMLNPIPECGELHSNQAPPVAPKPQSFLLKTTQLNNNNSTRAPYSNSSMCRKINELPDIIEKGLPRARLANDVRSEAKRKVTPTNIYNNNNYHKLQAPSLSRSNLGTSKLKPTNHYVINDVQYAKISRNSRY